MEQEALSWTYRHFSRQGRGQSPRRVVWRRSSASAVVVVADRDARGWPQQCVAVVVPVVPVGFPINGMHWPICPPPYQLILAPPALVEPPLLQLARTAMPDRQRRMSVSDPRMPMRIAGLRAEVPAVAVALPVAQAVLVARACLQGLAAVVVVSVPVQALVAGTL